MTEYRPGAPRHAQSLQNQRRDGVFGAGRLAAVPLQKLLGPAASKFYQRVGSRHVPAEEVFADVMQKSHNSASIRVDLSY